MSTRSFEGWIQEHLERLRRAAGSSLGEVLDAPEAAPERLSAEGAFALGVIAGAAGALDLTPRELVEAARAASRRPAR